MGHTECDQSRKDFFISYNHNDEAWAEWIADVLEKGEIHGGDPGLGLPARFEFRGRDAEGSLAVRQDHRSSVAGLSCLDVYAGGVGCRLLVGSEWKGAEAHTG